MASSSALMAALASTGFISLAPNLILLAFPQYGTDNGPKGSAILSMGQALAAGGLMGDVFLHTLSHATQYEDEHVGLWVLLGFTVFLIMDMLLRSMPGGHSHSHGDHCDEGEHANGDTSQTPVHWSVFLSSTVILNMAADALHNFTDGLAIGASFASHTGAQEMTMVSLLASRGGLATVSILFHEIPHELGDFCVLIKGGFTKGQAIIAQFFTAIAAIIGTLVGFLVVEGWGGQAIMYVTAGGFVYLASVTILPDVLDEKASLRFRFAQLLAFATGIAFMYAVSLLEGEHDHDHAHSSNHDHGHRDLVDHGHVNDHHNHGHSHEL